MQEQIQQSEKDRPRIVMLLANTFEHDTRVYKQARSLIEWGCDVHVLAMKGTALPLEEYNNSIQVHRLSIRRGDVLRLGLIVFSWWYKPLARLVLGSYRSPKPSHKKEAEKVTRFDLLVLRKIIHLIRFCIHFAICRIKRLAPSSLRLVAMNLQFARKALSLEPDIIQAHDLNMLLGGALVRRLSGVPMVYDSHELYLRRNIGNKSHAISNVVWAPIERSFIHKCDAVLSVADGICNHLAKQYKITKPHLIRNVQPYEAPQPKTTLLADELNIPKDKKIVIYAGAVTVNRGLEAMIDSAEHLENSVYVIMGYAQSAAYLQSLKTRASNQGVLLTKVFFREAVPIHQVTRYVASADLGIVPTQNVCLSYFFESSNKIFHCMMAGVPLAMSDHYEKRLLVEQYDIGVLFDETNPRTIASAVNEALADQNHYSIMRQNCFIAVKKMNWEHEQQKLRNIFAQLLGNKSPSIPQVMIENSPIENQAVTPAAQLLT